MAKERVSQEKGEARVQELMEMFPELPRQQVVKADILNVGIRPTPVLNEVGRWALPDTADHFEYGHEHGKGAIPTRLYFRNGSPLMLILDSASPYEVRYEGRGSYRLYRDGEPIEEVLFPPCPQWYRATTSSGTPMGLVMCLIDDQYLSMYDANYCEYFRDGNQCRYCNLNSTCEHFAELGQARPTVKREQDVYETYLAFAQEMGKTGVQQVTLTAGAFYNRRKEADLHIRSIEVLKRAMKDSGCVCENIQVTSQAMEEEDQVRLKEAGAVMFANNMEVWDPKLFPIICPGKAKNVGREHWIECMLKAVGVLGWGKVCSMFVLGVEMVPPFGFKSEEEGIESMVEGLRYLACHGVEQCPTAFRPVPGAVLAQAPRPRTEYHLRVERERQKLAKEYFPRPWGEGAGSGHVYPAALHIAWPEI